MFSNFRKFILIKHYKLVRYKSTRNNNGKVIKDDKQISSIESVTFQNLKNLSNLGLSTKKQK